MRTLLNLAIYLWFGVWPQDTAPAARRPGYPEHIGATAGYAATLRQIRLAPDAPELRADDPVAILRHVRTELEGVDRAIAEFGTRVGLALDRFIGPLDQTGELDRVELERLLSAGRELAVAQ